MSDPLKPSDIEDVYNSTCEHSTNLIGEETVNGSDQPAKTGEKAWSRAWSAYTIWKRARVEREEDLGG